MSYLLCQPIRAFGSCCPMSCFDSTPTGWETYWLVMLEAGSPRPRGWHLLRYLLTLPYLSGRTKRQREQGEAELDDTDIRNSFKSSELLNNPNPHILALRTFKTPDLWGATGVGGGGGACICKHARHVYLAGQPENLGLFIC